MNPYFKVSLALLLGVGAGLLAYSSFNAADAHEAKATSLRACLSKESHRSAGVTCRDKEVAQDSLQRAEGRETFYSWTGAAGSIGALLCCWWIYHITEREPRQRRPLTSVGTS